MSGLDRDYDPLSNVASPNRDDTGAGKNNKIFTFGYNELSPLTPANYDGELVTCTSDVVGNRLSLFSTVVGLYGQIITHRSRKKCVDRNQRSR